MKKSSYKGGGRTLAITVDDLLQSPRFKIAIRNFAEDPDFMRAILIELGMESSNATKRRLIYVYRSNSGLDQFELFPILQDYTNFNNYNIFWNLTPEEQALYIGDPRFELDSLARAELLHKVKKKFDLV